MTCCLRTPLLTLFATGLLLSSAAVAVCYAADASGWDGDRRSATRLIAGAAVGPVGKRTLRAGIQIRLAPGWKTYWRYPGDSGVPPLFDFSGSDNVEAITVLWPAPQRFVIDGLSMIGYSGMLILPLRITQRRATEPVTLRLKVNYGICEKLCVPVEAKAQLLISGTAGTHEGALVASELRVPKPAGLGQDGRLAVRAVRREPGPARPRLIIDVAAPAKTRVDLFAEGPTPEWALPLPELVADAAVDQRQFILELDGIPDGGIRPGAVLTLTAVSDSEAIEVKVPID